MTAEEVIKLLKLEPHTAEGGFFAETYRSKDIADKPERCCGTLIYYLLRNGDISRWHKVASDEVWLYSAGCPASQMLIFPDGASEVRIIGGNLENGETPQSIIPAGTWQAAVPLTGGNANAWGLFSAMVVPGFEYADFTGAETEDICAMYPALSKEIKSRY